ncbi:MAG: hypothetical protein K6T65_01140 [Peptococcaceae bacterium]|nr:hypothetical protein [Peptococcaceae bacterium]
MVIEKHYSGRPEDEEYVVRAFMLLIKTLENAERGAGPHPEKPPSAAPAGSRKSTTQTAGTENSRGAIPGHE